MNAGYDMSLAWGGSLGARRVLAVACDGWGVPSWARLPEREAWPWWFVTGLRGLHSRALVQSPSSFRRSGVFITSGALDRVRAGLGREDIRALLDDLSAELAERGARAEFFLAGALRWRSPMTP